MASTSASSIQKWFKYDVFLSFRGEDTRKTFVDHLYDALVQKGIITYKDEEKIKKGERISDQLLKSIEDSRFHIIVFSKNYASSSWCLEELVKIMECQKTIEQLAYPVFYHVEPTEVRYQSGAVGEAFANHVGKEAIGRWKIVLREAADLAGWELKNTNDGYETKLIQKIVQEISSKLHFINLSIDEKLQGMETRVKKAVTSLEVESDDVRMIGIKGMGGGGKTTLARAVFDYISIWFEGKSFVENVREGSKGSGLKELQKQVLSDVLNDQRVVVSGVSDGKNMMRRQMCSRKVLVVLDDVDHLDQLEALAGDLNWFKPGSRIIITTRDEQVLVAHGVHSYNIHNVSLLSSEEAIRLFSRYAFKREIPSQEYQELSEKVIQYAAGLPLTVKVLGSFLCGRSKCEWEEAVERLKTIPLKETLEKLELSYNGLENDYKEIFLEVACILKGERKYATIRVLESCGFHARIGLRVLEQKSLITTPNFDNSKFYDDSAEGSSLFIYLFRREGTRSPFFCLWLHDHLEEMGMNIVRRMHPNDPSRHSRLWIQEEIEDILVNDLGTDAIKSIKLKKTYLHPAVIMKGLRSIKELRVLYVGNWYNGWDIDEASQYLPDTLRSLHWLCYPFRCLPETFRANNLVNLVMEGSNISQLWEGGEKKVLNKLRFLCLKYSKLRTLDLGLNPNLEMLDLEGCGNFVELTMPPECPNLKYLNLGCSKLINLELGLTPCLETLNLKGCSDLVAFNMTRECPKLKTLNLSGSKVSNLNLELTPNIERLLLEGCYCLQEIHAPMGCLKKLAYLNLNRCLRFRYFLFDVKDRISGRKSFGMLQLTAKSLGICPLHPNSTLPKFQFRCKYDEPPQPFSIGNIEKLISFGLCACTNLDSFSSSICGLQYLRKLTLECGFPKAPKDLGQLESLEELTLILEEIKHLPDSICKLKHMKHLKIISCWLLEQLPTDLGRLEHLESLNLTNCKSLRDIPDSICEIKCLKHLLLPYCVLVEKLPEEIGQLNLLVELDIEGTGISHLPRSIVQLKGLRIIGSRWRLES